VGYYFQSQPQGAKERNRQRTASKQVPVVDILGTYSRLELPSYAESFDALYYVRIADDGEFCVERWQDEI